MPKMLDRLAYAVRHDVPMSGIAQLIGWKLTSVESERVALQLELRPEHANPNGTVHGGVLTAIADTAMGLAYATRLDDEKWTTVELKINFLRPATSGTLTASGWVVSAGRTLGMAEADVVDERGRLVARASCTCMTLRDGAARPG